MQMFVLKGKSVADNFNKIIYVAIKMIKKYYISRPTKSGLKYIQLLHDN